MNLKLSYDFYHVTCKKIYYIKISFQLTYVIIILLIKRLSIKVKIRKLVLIRIFRFENRIGVLISTDSRKKDFRWILSVQYLLRTSIQDLYYLEMILQLYNNQKG